MALGTTGYTSYNSNNSVRNSKQEDFDELVKQISQKDIKLIDLKE